MNKNESKHRFNFQQYKFHNLKLADWRICIDKRRLDIEKIHIYCLFNVYIQYLGGVISNRLVKGDQRDALAQSYCVVYRIYYPA